MSRIAYVNGDYVPLRDACVHVEDRGYQFADGVYEVIHVHGGRFVDEVSHMARLDRSLREMRMSMPMSHAAFGVVLREVVHRNRLREGLVYMQITRGVIRRDHAFPSLPIAPSVVITTKRMPSYPTDPAKWAAKAITHEDIRWGRCDIKTVGLLANVFAKQAAKEKGAAEAILIRDGMVTEGSSTSVWIVDEQGAIRTRHLDHAILPGCTRAALMDELRREKIDFEERVFSKEELDRAREVFITSATSFVRPIVEVDGRKVGDGKVGPVVQRLFEIFARHVQGDLKNVA